MNWANAEVELSKKLDPKHVHPPRQYGPKGSYIEGWHAIAEANRIFGFGAWSYEVLDCECVSQAPREIGQAKKPGFGVTYTARVRVTVDMARRDDVGAGHGYDVDCGLAHESAVKEAVTDALKRALRSFGNPFGLALYDKTRENVGVDLPPFNPRAAADRILATIAKVTDPAAMRPLWDAERDTLGQIKADAPPIYAEIRAAFAKNSEALKAEDQAA